MTKIIPVILSGGSGTRLWPLSTDARPKQFLSLVSDKTMFAETLARVEDTERFLPPIVIGAEQHRGLIEAELCAADACGARVILEPSARNTAPAIALAAIATGGGDSMMLVMPSDHVIADLPALLAAIDAARPMAQAGWLVTFGITPTAPETGFGYIQVGDGLENAPGVNAVGRFIEKPPREKAEAMLADGGHVWNAGIFLMRADRYLEELATYSPEIRTACESAMLGLDSNAHLICPDAAAFANCVSQSIDYAVMERSAAICVAPVSCGWSDVGCWGALADIAVKDDAKNTLIGPAIAINSANTLVYSTGMNVTTIGVRDMSIIAHGNEILVMPKNMADHYKVIQSYRGDSTKA